MGDSGPVEVVARPLNEQGIVQSQMPVALWHRRREAARRFRPQFAPRNDVAMAAALRVVERGGPQR
jgi:hypothetical protein